ncbi:MAG: YigZ family protein [Bacilli bacterium]|nr:YigZ family protein [Bacilli bacterium]
MYIIDKNVENEIIIKKSRFITKLIYIDDVNNVNDIINNLKKEYKKCTHICYAYIIDGKEKAVDDGEPSGTAGRPILNVLQKKKVTNILAVVIRYFGGIKLGAGGLVRSYTNSISEAFKLVNIKEKTK